MTEDNPKAESAATEGTHAASGAAATGTATQQQKAQRTRRPSGARVRGARRRVLGALATAVVGVATVASAVLALRILFVVFETDPNNTIVTAVDGLSGTLVWEFEGLFVPEGERLRVLVNHGIAAAVYLLVGRLVASGIRRLG